MSAHPVHSAVADGALRLIDGFAQSRARHPRTSARGPAALRTTANRCGGTQQRNDRIMHALFLQSTRHWLTDRGSFWIRGETPEPDPAF